MTTIPRRADGSPFGTQCDEVTAAQIQRADRDWSADLDAENRRLRDLRAMHARMAEAFVPEDPAAALSRAPIRPDLRPWWRRADWPVLAVWIVAAAIGIGAWALLYLKNLVGKPVSPIAVNERWSVTVGIQPL